MDHPKRPQLSIIVPAYNEAENLPGLLPAVDKVVKKAGLSREYIIVDDSSTDDTHAVATKLATDYPLQVVRKELPRGIGSGIRAGIAAAKGEVGVVVMADNVDPFGCIPRFYERIHNDGYKLAICSRYTRSENARNIPPLYKFWSRLYRLSSRVLLGIPLQDFTNAYRAFDLDFARNLSLQAQGFSISAEITFKTWFSSRKVCEVEGQQRKREKGKSSFSFRKFGFAYFKTFLAAVLYRFTRRWILS